MREYDTKITVRYAETDQMGIVHHSCYPVWFELGRTEFIREMGMPYSKVEESGYMLPLLELKCNYKGYAKYEDEILVKTRVSSLTYTRVVFSYQVFKNDLQEPITTGETMHVWTDKSLKPLNIKKHAPNIYQMLEKCI